MKYNTPDEAVKAVIELFGENILLDKNKFLAVFSDLAPEMKQERKIFSIALGEGIGRFFVNCPESDRETNIKLARKSVSLIMSDEAVRTVINAFSCALGWNDTNQPAESVKDKENISVGIEIVRRSGYEAVISGCSGGTPVTIGRVTAEKNFFSDLLRQCIETAENFLERKLKYISVSVPWNFTADEKRAVKLYLKHNNINFHFVRRCNAVIHAVIDRNMRKNIIILSVCGNSCEVSAYGISCGFISTIIHNSFSFFGFSSMNSSAAYLNDVIADVMEQAEARRKPIDEIYIDGDITGYPALVSQLEHGNKMKSIPERAVSWGTATEAYSYENKINNLNIIDVLSDEIRVEIPDGTAVQIMPKSAVVPARKTVVFSTYADNQTSFNLSVFQGNNKKGECRFNGILPAKAGIPKIEVTFEIDQYENIKISAECISFSGISRTLGTFRI